MTKLQLLHPITHDKVEYGRGLYEIGKDISEELAKYFLANMPHAARIYAPDEANKPGVIKRAADNPMQTSVADADKIAPGTEAAEAI